MDQLLFIMFVIFLWLLVGSACIAAWKDAFDDIESRRFRVSARIIMLVFWPAWLVIWVVCVAIGIAVMLLKDLFE